jgi:hypothetical protein
MRDRFRGRLQKIWRGIVVDIDDENIMVGGIEASYGATLRAGGERGIQTYELLKMRLGAHHPAVDRFFKMLPPESRITVVVRSLLVSVETR